MDKKKNASHTKHKQTESDINGFNLCYSDLPSLSKKEIIEKGYIGGFQGNKLYFELWSFPNSNYLRTNYLFLRTDTIKITNFDFCYSEPGLGYPVDTAIFLNYDFTKNEFVINPSLTLDNIPTFIQPLFVGLIGWQELVGLNKNGIDTPKIFFDNNNLILQYWDHDNLENSWLKQDLYEHNGQKFTFVKSEILKTIRGRD